MKALVIKGKTIADRTSALEKVGRKRVKIRERNVDKDDEDIEITSKYIKDKSGKVERHDVTEVSKFCNYNDGDYKPGDDACETCSMRFICAHNSVSLGKMQREEIPAELLKSVPTDGGVFINSKSSSSDAPLLVDDTEEQFKDETTKLSKKVAVLKKKKRFNKAD